MLALRILGIAVCSALAVKYGSEFYAAIAPSNDTSFDYQSASVDTQRGWLLEQAKPVTHRLTTGLAKTADGIPAHFEVQAYPGERAIETTITFSEGILKPRVEERVELQHLMMREWCPRYARSSLSAAQIEWRMILKEANGTRLAIRMTSTTCAI